MAKTSKTVHFEFAEQIVREPVLYKISRQFDVLVNVRRASVTDSGGFLDLELEGEEDEVTRAIEALGQWGTAEQIP